MNLKNCLCFVLLVATHQLSAQQNTLQLTHGESSPEANLTDISWIEGHWKGKAFGGATEEIWGSPTGGSMMCVFKHILEGKVNFYEIETITEIDKTLILRLKHFHSDLKGWEEKEKTIDFKLVKVTPEKVYFEGYTFERISENEMNVYVVIGEQGKESEVKFNYHK